MTSQGNGDIARGVERAILRYLARYAVRKVQETVTRRRSGGSHELCPVTEVSHDVHVHPTNQPSNVVAFHISIRKGRGRRRIRVHYRNPVVSL